MDFTRPIGQNQHRKERPMQAYNKFWVAAIMGILGLASAYGFIPETWADEKTVTTIVSLLAPALVWLVPNRT